LFAEVYGFL